MAAVLVVVADIQAHKPDEMLFAEDDDVFEELPAAAADPAFSRSVLLRTAIGDANRLCAHGPYELDHRRAEYRVAVEDQVSRRGVVGKRLTQLLHHPRRGWMERGIEVKDVTPAVLDDEEAVTAAEATPSAR